MTWMTWDDVKLSFGELNADFVEVTSWKIMDEACSVVTDDLSGYMDVSRVIAENGVPEQLKRLAIYKARELASITYWGNATTADKNPAAEYHRNEYNNLLTSIMEGNVQVVGYERPNNNQYLRFV